MADQSQTTDPKAVALRFHARLKVVEENATALRDVTFSIAESPGNEQTMRAALRLLVRAYDEGVKDVS